MFGEIDCIQELLGLIIIGGGSACFIICAFQWLNGLWKRERAIRLLINLRNVYELSEDN